MIALLALLAAAVGVVLPLAPTVPFLLVAAWAGNKGWPALEQRLLEHPSVGPTIRNWRARRVIPLRGKIGATAMMIASVVITGISTGEAWLVALLAVILSCVGVWLWRRPSR
ncbi:MAG: YbaN family protein [Halofilum sp. (in: g-proteobacteria)]